jgi:NADPH:quinone reductase-like Zn-dependent oxidoreductase
MHAAVVDEFGPDAVTVEEVPIPEVGHGQVRIKVAAAAVNPVDVLTSHGILAEAGLHAGAPVHLGWDVAGVIEDIGPHVLRLRVGQQVVGLSDRLDAASKTHADVVVLDEQAVAAVPPGSDLQQLALLPLAGLTAIQALERADLRRGQCLLVTGAAGAVGSLITQLARMDGIRVIGAGRPSHQQRIESLGAHFLAGSSHLGAATRRLAPQGVDAVIDCAGLGIASLDAVRNGGTHVSLVVLEQSPPLRGITSLSVAVEADWKQLMVLAGLAATGAIQLPKPTRYSITQTPNAYRRAAQTPGERVILVPDAG